jgi:RNA polymerase sigma-70 factor (ECF subfamily)
MVARGAVRDTVAKSRAGEARSAMEREAAFRSLASGHLEESYRLANAILGDRSESRDAVHDAFIKAWQQWPSLRDHTKFEWWFKRIVVNTCRNRMRDATRRRATDIEGHVTLAAPDESGLIHDRFEVEQALACLKPDDRVILAMRYYHDLTLADIAALLDVPTGTVKSRLSNAHARLRSVVDRDETRASQR